MSLRWPPKDPSERLTYSVDWSRFLGTPTVSSVTWKINGTTASSGETVDTLTLVNSTINSQITTVVFSGGTLNATYLITCTIGYTDTDGESLTATRTIKLGIREK